MNQHIKKQGFTIIEITIAMAFISVLIITLLMVGMQIASLYNKGVTIRDVNSASRNIVRSMQDDIAASSSRMRVFYREPVNSSGGTGGSSSGAATGSATLGAVRFATSLEEATREDVHFYSSPTDGGRLCTGSYTYIWNYRSKFIEYNTGGKNANGSLIADSGKNNGAQYFMSDSTRNRFEPVRFIKVKDEQRVLCSATQISDLGAEFNTPEYRNGLRIPDEFMKTSTAILGEGERGLVVYSFNITSPDALINKDGRGNDNNLDSLNITTMFYSSFYTINTTIGSSLFDEEYIGSVSDKDVKDSSCKTSNNRDSYAEYCALNNIEFVARTGSV